jgi:hypothetical protein
MSIALLPAVPRLFGSGFCAADQGCSIQPEFIGIKDEDMVIAGRVFLGLPAGFVAVVRVLPVEQEAFGLRSRLTDQTFPTGPVAGGVRERWLVGA